MVRAVADRAFLPTKNLLEQVGDMMILTGKTMMSALRPPYPYGGEFIGQFLFALRLCWFPLLISTVAFGYGAPGLQAGNFLVLFGALDRLGGFFVLASIREFAPFVTAIILAGVAGTALAKGVVVIGVEDFECVEARIAEREKEIKQIEATMSAPGFRRSTSRCPARCRCHPMNGILPSEAFATIRNWNGWPTGFCRRMPPRDGRPG